MRPIKFRGMIWGGIVGAGQWVYFGINGTDLIDVLIDETIGQFTGLLDKNGKEIYEGDVVQWREDLPRAEVTLGTLIEHCDNNERTGWIAVDCFVDKECKVIGNIYENPELIEVTP